MIRLRMVTFPRATVDRCFAHALVGLIGGALVLLGLTLVPATASAPGHPRFKECFSNKGKYGCESPTHNSLRFAWGLALSPDQRSLYVGGDKTITTFSRAPSGRLTYADCIGDRGARGCAPTGSGAIGRANDLAVSAAGDSLYATSYGAVSHLVRSEDGSLTYGGCVADEEANGCAPAGHVSLKGAEDIALSADGRSAYVASPFGSPALTRFDLAENGSLEYADCVSARGQRGCEQAVPSVGRPAGVAVSPDDGHVYVASARSNAVTHFSRQPDGGLVLEDCVANAGAHGCTSPRRNSLGGANDVTISPDGASLYVVGWGGQALTAFRIRADGSLRARGCWANKGLNGCRKLTRWELYAATAVAVSGDGRWVYTGSGIGHSLDGGPGALGVFARRADGRLAYAGCLADIGDRGVRGCKRTPKGAFGDMLGIDATSDSSLYVSGGSYDSVSWFKRRDSTR